MRNKGFCICRWSFIDKVRVVQKIVGRAFASLERDSQKTYQILGRRVINPRLGHDDYFIAGLAQAGSELRVIAVDKIDILLAGFHKDIFAYGHCRMGGHVRFYHLIYYRELETVKLFITSLLKTVGVRRQELRCAGDADGLVRGKRRYQVFNNVVVTEYDIVVEEDDNLSGGVIDACIMGSGAGHNAFDQNYLKVVKGLAFYRFN